MEQPFDVVTFRALHLEIAQIGSLLTPSGRIVGFPGGEESWSSQLEAAGWGREATLELTGSTRQVCRWTPNH